MFTTIDHFRGTRDHNGPRDRLRAIRAAALRFREELLLDSPVVYYRSFDLIRVPYPTRFAFRNATTARTPYVHLLNRMFVVQFDTDAGLKTMLVSPSDVEGNRETPFFKRLAKRHAYFGEKSVEFLAPQLATVEQCLDSMGLSPAHIDYITYDHLHTQDLRRWLGTKERPGFFPNAKLLVTRVEWESALHLLPPQKDWYCPNGLDGVDPSRVVFFEGDVKLGPGVALLHTPGHTMGNHSIVVRTPEGLMVTSENGVGPDAYAPRSSSISGLKQYAEESGMDVVLNGNTLESSIEQYLSMVQEKEIAGPSKRNPNFPNVVTSSEFTSYWLFPGIKPTFTFGELEFGQVRSK